MGNAQGGSNPAGLLGYASTGDVELGALGGHMGPNSNKDQLMSSIIECDQFLRDIRSHEAYHSLNKRLYSLKLNLEEIHKDPRHRVYLRQNGQVLNKIFGGLLKHLKVARKLLDRCLEAAKAAPVSTFQDEHEDLSHINKTEYFLIKDEIEILLAHHSKGISVYTQFLKLLHEHEKRQVNKRKTGARKITGTNVSGAMAPVGGHSRKSSDGSSSLVFGNNVEMKQYDTEFLSQLLPDKDAVRFWVVSVGEKVRCFLFAAKKVC